jgi:hypothetical protein
VINLAHWLHNPDKILARLQYGIWERLNPEKPWLCAGSRDKS